jgi:hypothetical protein
MSNKDNYADHSSRRAGLAPAPDTVADNDLGNYLVEDEAAAWGLDLRSASYLHQKIWAEQERFLAAFRDGDTIKAGLANVKVCRRTVELWQQQNLLQFSERFQLAPEDFCDSQEEIVYKLNKELKPGQTPLSVLATLNANRPSKWRPNVQVTHELGQRVMSALQAAQQRDRDEAAAVVEGESRGLAARPLPHPALSDGATGLRGHAGCGGHRAVEVLKAVIYKGEITATYKGVQRQSPNVSAQEAGP